jgi:hypothetical protein
LRLIAGGAILAALAALSALALPRGLADLRAFEARNLVNGWELSRRAPSTADWTRARARLSEARALDPGHPVYAEETGRLYLSRALQLPPAEALARDYARQGLEYHRAAVRLRPGASHSWANIALLKARLPEADAEFDAALRNAALLGPWEPDVQLVVAEAGFSQWARLAPAARAAVRDTAARALRWQDAQLFALARRTGRLGVVCALPDAARSKFATACI